MSSRSVGDCRFRRVVQVSLDAEIAECELLRRLAGTGLPVQARVSLEVCRACCRMPDVRPGAINGVVASMLRQSTRQLLQRADLPLSQRERAMQLDDYAVAHLEDRPAGTARPILRATPTLPVRRPRWLAGSRGWPRLGLVGWDTNTGLGYQNREIVNRLPIARWLIPEHPSHPRRQPTRHWRCRSLPLAGGPDQQQLRRFLNGLDWLLFVESPLLPELTAQARSMGIRVACVCNWEWTSPATSPWLYDVDLLICPTHYTWRLANDWKRRFAFAWRIALVPWPLDSRRFHFRQRTRCHRFLFVNGTGGCRGRYIDGTWSPYRRKGIEVLLEAARLIPSIPITVFSQNQEIPPIPRNVELRGPSADNRRLYQRGDVCVQPSHWEGLGLQLLECQAAGMPLITTDAPPMNEHHPWAVVPVIERESLLLSGGPPITAHVSSPEVLAEVMRRAYQREIADASLAARQFVERQHSWPEAGRVIRQALQETADA